MSPSTIGSFRRQSNRDPDGLAGRHVVSWRSWRRRAGDVDFRPQAQRARSAVSDRVAMVTPIGLFLGRLSNFVNAELYGRATSLPWGMVFPGSDGQPRHPSQLYEAGLEGLVLGAVMLIGWRRGWLGNAGSMTAALLIGYGLARFLVEYVRQPDPQLGILLGLITMGQLLCLPMIAGRRFHYLEASWPMTGKSGTGLANVIRARIARTGPMDVADYMAICLGDPNADTMQQETRLAAMVISLNRAGNLEACLARCAAFTLPICTRLQAVWAMPRSLNSDRAGER